uniref:Uncharacterized protein n=1 Tax=Aegilops tauschii subsp. strangulata TaxID=200361 RepID=A0A452XY21_AEGTS
RSTAAGYCCCEHRLFPSPTVGGSLASHPRRLRKAPQIRPSCAASMAAAAAAGDSGEQPLLHLKLAFLALEPPACVLTLARKAGGGSVTPHVQNFILENCVGTNVGGGPDCTYVKTILKKVIAEAELSSDIVIDELYEEFGRCMSSRANNPELSLAKIYKEISFLSPAYENVSSNPVSLVARLLCSTNMLEGDTGCCLWPSSLFLSEFILSFPELFAKKCCFEVKLL